MLSISAEIGYPHCGEVPRSLRSSIIEEQWELLKKGVQRMIVGEGMLRPRACFVVNNQRSSSSWRNREKDPLPLIRW